MLGMQDDLEATHVGWLSCQVVCGQRCVLENVGYIELNLPLPWMGTQSTDCRGGGGGVSRIEATFLPGK